MLSRKTLAIASLCTIVCAQAGIAEEGFKSSEFLRLPVENQRKFSAKQSNIEHIWVDETEAIEIDAHNITYRVTGSIDATLDYGSNSDFRNGDGATIDHNFPYECVLKAPVGDPQDFEDGAVLAVQDGGWHD